MTLIDKIREMVAEGQTEKSIDELMNYVRSHDNDLLDRIILLKSRLHDLNVKVLNDTIEQEDASRQRARINEAILKILHEITPSFLEDRKSPQPGAAAAPPRPASTGKSEGKGLVVALIAVIILVGGYFFIDSLGGSASVGSGGTSVALELPRFEHNVQINGIPWMKIWQPGTISGAKGKTAHVVCHFMMNNQFLLARFDEVSYRDPNGYVATTTGPIPISTDPHDLSRDTMYIPYTSFNLISTGGQTTYTIQLYSEIFLDNLPVKTSSSQPFYVTW